jgi:hypothetical protein
MPTRTVTVEICGREVDVEADFTVDSFGSCASFLEPGDPPEISVDKVWYADDPTERDVSAVLSELRDLSTPGVEQYGCGFEIHHGFYVSDPCRPLDRRHVPPRVTFNRNRSILDAVEEDIYENFHEYEGGDYDDY